MRPRKASLEPSPRMSTPARRRAGPDSSTRPTTWATGSKRRSSPPPPTGARAPSCSSSAALARSASSASASELEARALHLPAGAHRDRVHAARPVSRRWRSSCAAAGGSPGSPTWCFSSLRQTASRTVCSSSASEAPPRSTAAQVGLVDREEAGAQLAVGGQADAVAVGAERLGHRVDEAELAAPVREAEHARGGVRPRAAPPRAGAPRGRCARISSPVSTWSWVHAWSPSSGMNSMKRTWKLVERANSANGSASSSVKPRSATAFTLIGRTSGKRAIASRPRSTCGSESRRVSWKKRSRWSESIDTFTRLSPAGHQRLGVALEQVAVRGEREVLEARAPRRASRAGAGTRACTSGSPPGQPQVGHAHRGEQPHERARSPRSAGSPRGRATGSPSAGMQYWQRKLQRSVTETRRSEIAPSVSVHEGLVARHVARKGSPAGAPATLAAWSSRRWRSALHCAATAGSRRCWPPPTPTSACAAGGTCSR